MERNFPMTRITHPTMAYYFHSRTSTSNQPPAPDRQAVKQLQASINASNDTARPMFTRPNAPTRHHYFSQAYNSLVQAHQPQLTVPQSQGRQAALDMMAKGRFTKDHITAALAKYADTPHALAGFFASLGPQNTLNALLRVDHHDRDVMGPSGYAPVVDPAKDYLWVGKGHLQAIDLLEARHRDRHREQRGNLAEALSKAMTGGLSDAFVQDLADAASTTPRAANQLSQILVQSSEAALIPLKDALFNTLMTPQKALNPVSDVDTRGWVRAAMVLLENNSSDQWLEPLQDHVGSTRLSRFIATAVQGTVNITGLDGSPYGDEDYQRGLEGLLSGLSRLQGEKYTTLKAHVFSAASNAMGETHVREALTEGLKALFVSDPKGIAMEIKHGSSDFIQSNTAFSFFFKETLFNNLDFEDKFINAVSLTLKDLYQDATNGSLSQIENENSSMTLGVLFGSLQAAFEDAKLDNRADQDAVHNMVNVLTGFATIFPGISIGLAAAKDGIVVPFFSNLFNGSNRTQAEKMELIDETFNKLVGAMTAGFNGHRKQTGGNMGGFFNYERTTAERDGANGLGKN